MDLLGLCATFISFEALQAFLVRMYELVFFRMVAAQPVATELLFFSNFLKNYHACVLHPNNAPENDADTIHNYGQISKT